MITIYSVFLLALVFILFHIASAASHYTVCRHLKHRLKGRKSIDYLHGYFGSTTQTRFTNFRFDRVILEMKMSCLNTLHRLME